jgi:hypothetical protein
VWRDLRFGLRLLARSPVFALTAALLLGIGIGANTLIFSLVDTVLLRPLPVAHPEQLVRLIEVHPGNFITWSFPFGLYEHFPAAAAGLNDVFCQGDIDVAFESGGSTERIRVNAVSPNFFSMIGPHAAQGRALLAEDERTSRSVGSRAFSTALRQPTRLQPA